MKTRSILAIIMLFAFTLAACGQAAPVVDAPPVENPPVDIAPVTEVPDQPEQPAASEIPAELGEEPAATEAPVQPVATSRGPDLEATDPATVVLASGELQLVEFFRFT